MKVGTKSILFGVHAFWLHPWIVLCAWFIVHRRFPSLAEFLAIFTHDLGYWGMPNMDGDEGSSHPERAAKCWRGRFGAFGDRVAKIIIGHSRFHASKNGIELSTLFQPDKLATALYRPWLYLLLANLSGEIKEYIDHYRNGKYTGEVSSGKSQTQIQWLLEVQAHMALMGLLGKEYYIVKKQMAESKADCVLSLAGCEKDLSSGFMTETEVRKKFGTWIDLRESNLSGYSKTEKRKIKLLKNLKI